jgi:hypothetical protein
MYLYGGLASSIQRLYTIKQIAFNSSIVEGVIIFGFDSLSQVTIGLGRRSFGDESDDEAPSERSIRVVKPCSSEMYRTLLLYHTGSCPGKWAVSPYISSGFISFILR